MFAFLAYRNLIRRRRRYFFILSAMALSFAVITLLTGISSGAMEAIKDKAGRYFAGHISITGFLPNQVQYIENPEKLLETLQRSSLPLRTLGLRTIYYRGDAQLFYEGERVEQRRLIGINPDAEAEEFNNLEFLAGGFTFSDPAGRAGILISQDAAKLLRCQVGDSITLSLRTFKGQLNTAPLVVTGIFAETSLFDYAAYMDRHDLNSLMGVAPNYATDLALYTKAGTNITAVSRNIHEKLSSTWRVAPLYTSREARDADLGRFLADGPGLVIMQQDAQLAQIQQFIKGFLI